MDIDERMYKLNLNSKYDASVNAIETVDFVQHSHNGIDGGESAVASGGGAGGGGGKVTHLVQQLQQQANESATVANIQHGLKGFSNCASTAIGSEAFYLKKVGPLVPPKPNKKHQQQTLVTSNSNNNNAKSTYESLYETAASASPSTGTVNPNVKTNKMLAETNKRGSSVVSEIDDGSNCNGRTPILLHCKSQSHYSGIGVGCGSVDKPFNSKVTLDIPVVLDQQLEALTHHKMQLEKRGLLQQQQQQQQRKNSKTSSQQQQQQHLLQQQLHSNHLNTIPKLSSTSLLTKDMGVGIYTNLPISISAATGAAATAARATTPTLTPLKTQNDEVQKIKFKAMEHQADGSSCYSNMSLSRQQDRQQEQQQLYTNLINQPQQQHHQHQNMNLGAAMAMVKTLNLADLSSASSPHPLRTHLINARSRVGHEDDEDDDDEEIPPPPSPVSSSYSELRRATTNNANLFNIMPTVAAATAPGNASTSNQYVASMKQQMPSTQQQQLQQHDKKQQHYALDGANKMQNAYMNVHYGNNDYNNTTYSPTLQTLSQSSSTDYYGYSTFSQGTSTYESIYEPINLRPTSQMSLTHSSNSLAYGGSSNGGGIGGSSSGYQTDGKINAGSGVGAANVAPTACKNHQQLYKNQEPFEHRLHQHHVGMRQQPPPPEAEVEALTNFLVNSMQPNSGGDVDDVDDDNEVDDDDERLRHDENYGICYKCNERILGETSGCTAMDQTYHIACFTCSQCQVNLQGKPFYALDSKPYCEYDYLQTLEKCSVCMKPILERILRATGKPYHPQCFTCIVCNKSLDGIPFTVDATNQNYCIADFHKKFAPRCCVCKEPIMPAAGEEETVRVVALDRSFHFECYKCEDCGLLLSSEADGRGCYPLDDHVLCKSCNANRVQMLTNRMTTEL